MIETPQYERLVGSMLGPYHLEQLSEWNELGPVFVGRQSTDGGTFRIRLLEVPTDFSSNEFAAYLQRLDNQARHVATLQHPYILPLTQFGSVSGICYVVSPYPTARSLSTRLKRSGPLDVVTAGRYLDQIAAALEYAHERNTLHRNLTPDTILLQLDGQIVVADFGIRRMLELAEREGQRDPLRFLNVSSAPEQILGGAVDRQTDVYALGAVLYQLLTGYPVYTGSSPEMIAEQHLRAPIPSLSARRTGMPAALDAVLARALAKRPQDRFQHPGELANAYAQIVSPNNSARVPFVISQPVLRSAGPPSFTAHPSRSDVGGSARGMSNGYGMPFTEVERGAPGEPPSSGPVFGERTPLPRNRQPMSALRIALVAVVLTAVVVGGVLGVRALKGGGGPRGTPGGQIVFLDSQGGAAGQTNALRLSASNLADLPSGSSYYAWLIDTQAEHVTALGQLQVHDGSATLNFADSSSSDSGLLGLGNTIEITQENGRVSVPVGKVVLIGTFPPKAFVHIQHVLVAFPATPGHVGLIVGALRQYQLLNTQVQVLAQAAQGGDQASVRCQAQGIVDILEGSKGKDYRPLSPQCTTQQTISAGDGYGLIGPKADGSDGGYINFANDHASLASQQADATANMHTHAAQVEAALNTVLTLSLRLRDDAVALLKNPGDSAKVSEMVTLARNAYEGADTNGDGKIDQAGLLTAYEQAQQMATLPLVPRS